MCSTPVKHTPVISFSQLDAPISPISINSDTDSSDFDGAGNSSGDEDNDRKEEPSLEEEHYKFSDSILCFLNQPYESQNVSMESDVTCGSQVVDRAFNKALMLNNIKVHSGSELSVNEGILDIMNMYIKNKLSKAGLHRAIQTVCKFLPDDHQLPTSSHLILSYMESLAPEMPPTIHYYCEICYYYHGVCIEGQCIVCQVETNFKYFFNFDVGDLIKYFFEHRNLAAIMDLEQTRNVGDPSVLKDIRDGSVYKSINATRNRYDVNIMMNTDGVRIRKGSKKELWLAMFTIVEIPIHLQRSFLSVIGVWYGEKKPDMKTFLKPFADRMESLDKHGVEWTHPVTKVLHKSHVRLPVVVLDAPARAIVQNCMHFNSRYGCNLCEVKAQLSAHIPNKKCVRIYHYVQNPKLRTKERMLVQAAEVGNKKHIKGIKGPSILSTIPSVDISQCIIPEYMHSVLLGVVKQILMIWTSIPGDWSIKRRISEIDNELKSFRHPDFVHRKLRQLKSLKFWKASDFYYFLLFEAVPTLSRHLPNQYFQHLILLVKGIFTLLKAAITREDISEADLLLKLFVNEFFFLYGDRQLTYNVHQLTHLGLCVQRYGPLFCHSAFSFEDLNGMVAKSTHGTNFIDSEIVKNIKICQGVQLLKNIVRGTANYEVYDSFSQGQLLGKDVDYVPTEMESEVLGEYSNFKCFSRAKLGYDLYTSEIYKPLNSQNYFVKWKQDRRNFYGSIRFFFRDLSGNFVVIRKFTVDHTGVFYHSDTLKCIEHIVPVNTSNSFVAIKLEEFVIVVEKVGKVDRFIYERPNLYRYVM